MSVVIVALIFTSISLSLSGVLTFWSKLSNIGDSISHSFVFTLVISYFFNTNEIISIIIASILFVSFIFYNESDDRIDGTSRLLILSSFAISSAIFINEFTHTINIKDLLFGNIFSVRFQELGILGLVMLVNITFFSLFYKKIVLFSFSKEIAKTNGINIFAISLIIKFLIVLTSAFSIKILGGLLISSLLVIPAAISRLLSKTPIQMIFLSVLISIGTSLLSIGLSYKYDFPYAPTFALVLCLLYFFSSIFKSYRK
jgi:zinc transport system permease protein